MVGYTLITPAMAESILNKNTFNRPLRAGVVEKYMRDMLAGKWRKNGSTIVLTVDGTLLDGQHRLFAIVEAACHDKNFRGVEIIIVRDADMSALPTIDTGLARTFADFKKLEASGTGHVFPYADQVSAVLRLVYWYNNQWPRIQVRTARVSHQELDDLLQKNPTIPELVGEVGASDKLRRLRSASTTAFVYAMAARQHPNEARAWLDVLKTGDGEKTHPAMVLRQQLIDKALAGKVLDPPTRLVWTIKSWNAFAQTDTIGRIRWGVDEPMPAIFGTPQYTGKMAARTKLLEMKRAPNLTREQKIGVKQAGVRRRRKAS